MTEPSANTSYWYITLSLAVNKTHETHLLQSSKHARTLLCIPTLRHGLQCTHVRQTLLGEKCMRIRYSDTGNSGN